MSMCRTDNPILKFSLDESTFVTPEKSTAMEKERKK